MTIAVAAAVIFAAITVGFMLRHRLAATARSASGFTLQTLIVTAVLVLVAVGATAIFIALSRSNERNLAESDSDIEAREQQHGVIDPEGNLSYTWRCSLHEEYVLKTNGEAGTCQTRCYAKLNDDGAAKWNYWVNERSDLTEAQKADMRIPTPVTIPPGNIPKATFSREDFGEFVYSETDPGYGEFELRGNGNAILLDGTCILASELCSFGEQRREALIRRWEDSVDRSLSGRSGGITFERNILGLRDFLEC